MKFMGIPENSEYTLSERNGLLFDSRSVFIPCCPYSISIMLEPKPAFVAHDEMPLVIVRVFPQFGK
jgi:hypothetical protein